MALPFLPAQAENPAGELPAKLVELTPAATEFGMARCAHDPPVTREMVGAIDTSVLGEFASFAGSFWPDARKIVAELDPDLQMPEGEVYSSERTDVFAVQGEWMTGVGLWGKVMNQYHWVEYEIPGGATRFTGELHISDDPLGYTRGRFERANQLFHFTIQVDDREMHRAERLRHAMPQGSGQKLQDLAVDLPSGAQRIRFRLQVGTWGDGNNNIELVIHDGTFH